MTIFWTRWFACERRLRRLALRWMGGNRSEAEDAVSDAAVRALEKLTTTPPRADHDVWLERLLYSVCMDRHRRRRTRERVCVRLHAPILAGDEPRSPEDALLVRDRTERILGALDRLQPELRDAISLRFLDGRSYLEIASARGISAVNARKRVQLARAALRAEHDRPHPDAGSAAAAARAPAPPRVGT
jgi:RNA polymerase sigma-70 factor (ECF subfamily)